MTDTQLIVGMGEVGRGLAEVVTDAHTRDIDAGSEPEHVDVLHVCFPYSVDFVQLVRDYQHQYRAGLVVVHSTVPVGTCDPNGWVHSPIRGKHPDLAEGIRTFVKIVGGARADQVARLLERYGVPTKTTELAANAEAAKLWELAQYGIQITVEKAIHSYCERAGLDFDLVYTTMANTYNLGYIKLGEYQYVRPVLEHQPGPIGGHCVVMGSLLLEHELGDLVADASRAAEQEAGQ